MGMERSSREPTFVDAVTLELGGPRTAGLLSKLDAAVPWEMLAKSIRPLYRHGDQGGRRPWPAVLMLKCLMLQKWFGLSDPQLEEQLRDRLSFRRFVALSLEDDTPDETTFVRFRGRLRESNLDATLFEKTLAHLDAQGLIVQEGTLVDATILQAPRGKSKKDARGRKVGHTRDPQASYTKKHGQTYHGYKGHIATDKRGLIVKQRFDTAKVHDSKHFDALTADESEGGAAYADAAYMDQQRQRDLESRGVFCGIICRRVRGQKQLPRHQQLINQLLSKTRAIVEHPFAWMSQMGYSRVRYRGLRRNAFDFALMSMAYNFKRSLSLVPL